MLLVERTSGVQNKEPLVGVVGALSSCLRNRSKAKAPSCFVCVGFDLLEFAVIFIIACYRVFGVLALFVLD